MEISDHDLNRNRKFFFVLFGMFRMLLLKAFIWRHWYYFQERECPPNDTFLLSDSAQVGNCLQFFNVKDLLEKFSIRFLVKFPQQMCYF